MAEISAKLVKELRERTGAAMMDCKKALVEVGGDIEAAIEHMRKTGLAKAEKKASRVAAEGVLVTSICDQHQHVVLLEANCETDFVAMGDEFGNFAKNVTDIARKNHLDSVEALSAAEYENGVSVDDTRKALVAKIGENMNIRRFVSYVSENGVIGSYLHGKKIGVLVELTGNNAELAKQIAMHIAAANPQAIKSEDLDPAFIEKERGIAQAKAEQSGKPADVAAKIAEGALNKILKEVTLLGQPFVIDPSKTVEQLLKENKAEVIRYTRYELGEGIEKEESDFVAEVMAQAKGS